MFSTLLQLSGNSISYAAQNTLSLFHHILLLSLSKCYSLLEFILEEEI